MRALVLALGLICVPTHTGPDRMYALIGYQSLLPTPLHAAIHFMVATCMDRDPHLKVVGWAVADGIIDLETGEQAYGATILTSDSTAVVIMERRHWLDSRVISHEMIHIVGGLGLGERSADPAWRCEMNHDSSLAKRPPVGPDSLEVLVARMGAASYDPPPQGRP